MAARKGNRFVIWAVFGLLAVGLVGWGGTAGVGTGRSDLGTVGGLPVSAQAYANALRSQLQAFEEQIGAPLTMEQAQASGLDRAVLGQVVAERALDAEVARLGLSAGDARIAETVRDDPAFQGPAGFDRELYREQLARIGLSEAEFERSIREETARRLLQAAVLSGLPEPRVEAEAMADWIGERRTVTWALLPSSELEATLPAPTEEELRAYHEANPDAFTTPEVRALTYAAVTPESLLDPAAVPEEDVRQLYESRLSEFVQEERRLVERLVFGTEEEAAEARARLDAGEVTFDALVAERGLNLSDVDLGDVTLADLDDAGEAVFATPVGEVAGPIASSLGPALFRVNATLAAEEVTFDEAEESLRAEIADERAREAIADARGEIEDLVAGGAAVEDVAERTILEPGSIEWSEGVTDGIAAYAAFREAAAAAEPDAFPELSDLEDGGLFVLRLDGVTPPALRPFEEARADVEAAWRADRLREATLAEATARAEAIAGGATFEAEGLTPTTEPPLTRRDFVEGAPTDLMTLAFAMAEGEAQAVEAEGGAVVLRLDAVAPPPEGDEGVEAERAQLARQLSGGIAQDLYAAYAGAIQLGTEVRIDEARVAGVNAQFQ